MQFSKLLTFTKDNDITSTAYDIRRSGMTSTTPHWPFRALCTPLGINAIVTAIKLNFRVINRKLQTMGCNHMNFQILLTHIHLSDIVRHISHRSLCQYARMATDLSLLNLTLKSSANFSHIWSIIYIARTVCVIIAHFSSGYNFMMGLNPSCMLNLKSLASGIAKISQRSSQISWSFVSTWPRPLLSVNTILWWALANTSCQMWRR